MCALMVVWRYTDGGDHEHSNSKGHLARSSKRTVASFDDVISVAIFSGLGLLISVSVLLLDRYVPGDWF